MKKLSFLLGLVVCIVVSLAVSATPVFAQGETGSVTGVVTDSQGATVAGADVTLTDIATKSPRTTTTNESGRYHFASVPVGQYDIVISKSGFKVHKAASQRVSVGNQLTVDVALEVGSLSETVVITSQAGSELQTANATIGNTISLKDLELLPNLGRDATSLLGLQPGVTPRGDIAGSYMDQNTFTIDGGNNTDDMAGNTIGYIQNFTGLAGSQTSSMASGVVATPIETVEEFKVSTFGQTNDFNASSGAQVQMVTRRGTDQWHGSGYGYYYATNHGAANSWLANHTSFTKGVAPDQKPCSPGTTLSSGDNNCVLPFTPIIPNHRSRFGFTVGGPVIPWKIAGGKTFLFFGYEGFRFPGSGIFEKQMPSLAMRAGVIQIPVADPANPSKTIWQPYNLNPTPVNNIVVGNAANGDLRTVSLPGTGTTLDPRGIGISPTVSTLWSKFMPVGTDPLCSFCPSLGDGYNTLGYLSTIRTPLTSNNYVWRLDHDFSAKHRFFGSFRAFKLLNVTTSQVDVGGALPGGTFGQYTPQAPRPQLGELMVLGLTSNLSSRVTNDLRLSYLWNWWQWSTQNDPPQLPGLGGALEIAPNNSANSGGAESTSALIPYNVNNQSTRQRVWDGQDKMLRDDVTWVKGNHVFQFGGNIQHNFNYHTRTDNGSTINNQIVYQIAFNQIDFGSSIPAAVTAAGQTNMYKNLAASVLGLVGLTQVIYTRVGSDLKIQPIGTVAQELSTIKYYSGYGADTWRIRPSLTLSYGLSYMYETPPVEKNGAQVELVYPDGSLVHTDTFLAKRKAAALAGTPCTADNCDLAPILGFETTGNLHMKYPYNPFKRGFSPRFALAWNPNYRSGLLGTLFGEGKTVLRGGYGRTWGRINGVNQVLVPLLGPGLLQPVTCSFTRSDGSCATSNNLANAFRIGPDGLVAPLSAPTQTLPQPFLPGRIQNGILNAVAGDSTVLDPDYKPEKVDTWDFTIQRQISRRISFEAGYMGKRSRNIFEEINLDAVPYMMTLGGQTFANAFANIWTGLCSPGAGGRCTQIDIAGTSGRAALIASIPNQAFLEAALGGAGSAFCRTSTGAAISCTQALLSNSSVINSSGSTNLFGQTRVSELWAFMNSRSAWTLGRTMLSSQATAINTTTSLGYSNYNALFLTLKMNDWHGLTSISNFTWGKSLGTAQIAQYNSSNQWLDIWNPKASYGPQVFDIKFLFTSGWSYRPTFFKGAHGWKGKLLDGWSISPFVTAQSGFPIGIGYTEGGTCSSACQAFGEMGNVSSSGTAFESAIPLGPFTGGHSAHTGIPGSVVSLSGINVSVGTTGNPSQVNIFADPASVYANFRRCILGIDTSCGGVGNLRGLNRWNMDATLAKDFKFTERVGATFTVQFTNVLNHFQPSDPSSLSLTSNTSFGRITSAVYAARQMEIGLRIHF